MDGLVEFLNQIDEEIPKEFVKKLSNARRKSKTTQENF